MKFGPTLGDVTSEASRRPTYKEYLRLREAGRVQEIRAPWRRGRKLGRLSNPWPGERTIPVAAAAIIAGLSFSTQRFVKESPPKLKWWQDPSVDSSWNGVFQGGGAKGTAYLGASWHG